MESHCMLYYSFSNQVETMMKQLGISLPILLKSKQSKWYAFLEIIENQLNLYVHLSTNLTHGEKFFGTKLSTTYIGSKQHTPRPYYVIERVFLSATSLNRETSFSICSTKFGLFLVRRSVRTLRNTMVSGSQLGKILNKHRYWKRTKPTR